MVIKYLLIYQTSKLFHSVDQRPRPNKRYWSVRDSRMYAATQQGIVNNSNSYNNVNRNLLKAFEYARFKYLAYDLTDLWCKCTVIYVYTRILENTTLKVGLVNFLTFEEIFAQ